MNCKEAKNIDLVDYLYQLGFEPQKIRGWNYWFLSPLRMEKNASFKVDRKRNNWYDFGEGRGGNVIDFGILYHNCSVRELLYILSGQRELPRTEPEEVDHTVGNYSIQITRVEPLRHPALIQYCQSRGISMAIAAAYCRQATFTANGKSYFALCFKNNCGGHELRNAFYKGSSAPKDITLIENGCDYVAVFEGFFDFLSYLMLRASWDLPAMDYLILNSLSFFQRANVLMHSYTTVNLFLDNDPAGRSCTTVAIETGTKFNDCSLRYSGFTDLNDYLRAKYSGNTNLAISKPP